MECFEFLTKVINELEGVVWSLDKDNSREKNEALVYEFFRIFRDVERMMPEGYEEVGEFLSCFEAKPFLRYYNGFFMDWDSMLKSYVVRWDEGRRVQFLKDNLQALVWGLVGKALKYLPNGEEALAQAYEDLLNGFEGQTDIGSLEILLQLGLDEAKAYSDYMSMKEKYKGQIKDFEKLLGLRQILSLSEKNRFNYAARVKLNDWWSKIYLFNQLDTALLNELDSIADPLISLDTLVKLDKIYRKKGWEDVQNILSLGESGVNGAICVEDLARSKILSNILGEGALQYLKSNPALIPPLKQKLGSRIIGSLQKLETLLEERMESRLLKTRENHNKVETENKVVSDPPFITLYHAFFSPIIWTVKKVSHKRTDEVSIDEMEREIERFNPDRYRDFPLWWAKEKYKEKISQANEKEREKLMRLFYKLVKGNLEVDKYQKELSSS